MRGLARPDFDLWVLVLPDGVIGNTLDFDSRKSRFEPWRDNRNPAYLAGFFFADRARSLSRCAQESGRDIGKPWRDNTLAYQTPVNELFAGVFLI